MREILFRGRSENGNGWVEGSLVITNIEPADDTPIKHYHIEDMTIGVFPNEFQSGLSETVDPETVGQFTGLTDKNGKKIFEGDACRFYGDEGYSDYVVFWDDTHSQWAARQIDLGAKDVLDGFFSERCEIIGNIHDNPELLEVDSRGKN